MQYMKTLDFNKKFVDLFYKTKRVKSKFETENPNELVLASDACKAISTKKDESIQKGFNWVISQRDVILLTNKRIIFDQYSIPLEIISSAELVQLKTMFGKGQVLKVSTIDNDCYQFGMQFNSEWLNQKVLPLTIEKGQIEYSTFSILIRIFIVGYLIYWLYGELINK